MANFTGDGAAPAPAAPKKVLPPALSGGLQLLPLSLANQGAQLLPTSLAQDGAQMLSPSWAATLAGTQYDQAIADAQANLQAIQSGGAQALQNVEGWWNQILGSQAQAASNDQAIGQSVAQGEQNANAGILASLGGDANPGATSVAEVGQNNLGTLGALNQINAQYNQNLAPILKMGAAGAFTQQQDKNAADYRSQLQAMQDLVAQKGATQAQYAYDIAGKNNDIRDAQQNRLIQLMQANNQTRDTRAQTLASIVGANNQTKQDAFTNRINAQQLTDSELQNKRSYALQLRGIQDTEEQNQLATILAVGIDPTTGTLTKGAAQAIGQLTGIDPKSLSGTNASTATSLINTKTTQAGENARSAVSQGLSASRTAATWTRTNHYQSDANGNPVGGKIVPTAGYVLNKAGTGVIPAPKTAANGGHVPGTLSDSEAGKLVQGWFSGHDQHDTVRNGTLPNGGTRISSVTKHGVGVLTYQQAVEQAQAYPPQSRAKLMSQINATWQPGQNGRPWLNHRVMSVLAKVGPQIVKGKSGQVSVSGGPGRGTHIASVNGHQVLDPAQYQALQQAGLLPYGQLTQEGFFVVGGGNG